MSKLTETESNALTPSSKKKFKEKFTKVPKTLIFLTLTIVSLLLGLNSHIFTSTKEVPKEIKQEQIKVVDPEIQILSDYIKLRNEKLPVEIANIIAVNVVEVSSNTNIAVPLIVGIIEKESHFNPMATSNKYARGLMQILRGEAVVIDVDRAYDIKYNIETGCAILSGKLIVTKGNLVKALSNYSGGASNYSENVMQAVGRYTIYKYSVTQKGKEETVADIVASLAESVTTN